MLRSPIPYGKQEITAADIAAVTAVLSADFLTQGPQIELFEKQLASYCGAKYAVVVANGTAALHLVYLALGLKQGQKIATSAITFAATSNAALYCGAETEFIDISPGTFMLDPHRLAKTLTADQTIRGVVPVHLAGVPCALEEIYSMAREKNLWVVEDACHAIGSKWRDQQGVLRRVGDCAFSDAAVFSFHPVKQLAAGEGGAIVTNHSELYHSLLKLRSHGITKDPRQFSEQHGPWYHEMQILGYNYRITDMQCALASSQLSRLDQAIKKRRLLVDNYHRALGDHPKIKLQSFNSSDDLSFHLLLCQAEHRGELFSYLNAKNIFPQVHYIPVYQHPFYRQRYKLNPSDFPHAQNYYQQAISLPLYHSLSVSEQEYVIATIKEFYGEH